MSPTIQVTGNSIQKVSGTSSWYDAGAVSSQTIVSGDGYMEFTPGETATWRMAGLGNNESSAHYSDIEYAFFMVGSTLNIYESGTDRGSFGTYTAGDRLKVAVENGAVKYYRNGALVYTSTVAPAYPLQVDTSLNTVNAGVYNVVITSNLQNVSWSNVSPTIQVTGNSIQKISGTNAWDAGAVSAQAIVAGDGYMEFTPGETGTYRMAGLGNTDSSAHYGDIEFAFFVAGGGTLQIYESGTERGTFGTYAAGDRLKVAVENGVVKYYRNGALVYTSTVGPAYPLQVDTSLNTVNAGVYNVVISGLRVAENATNYVLSDVQGSTRAVMSGASMVARHDFLRFGEEIAVNVGMRTSGQGFSTVNSLGLSADKIRQRYGLTERDDATGLDHTWWRKYEDRSGRWTSADPYRGSMTIANPQSFNRYTYVQNDPVNFVDPSGLDPGDPVIRTWTLAPRDPWLSGGRSGGIRGVSPPYVVEPRDRGGEGGGGEPPGPQDPLRTPQPSPHPKPDKSQQRQFDDCLAPALNLYRGRLPGIAGKTLAGGAGLGVGIAVFKGGPSVGFGVGAAARTFAGPLTRSSLFHGLMEIRHASSISLPINVLSGITLAKGLEQLIGNRKAFEAAIADCAKKWPRADAPSF